METINRHQVKYQEENHLNINKKVTRQAEDNLPSVEDVLLSMSTLWWPVYSPALNVCLLNCGCGEDCPDPLRLRLIIEKVLQMIRNNYILFFEFMVLEVEPIAKFITGFKNLNAYIFKYNTEIYWFYYLTGCTLQGLSSLLEEEYVCRFELSKAKT